MSDIIIQLRTTASLWVSHIRPSENILNHAADEIEKLRGEVEIFRRAFLASEAERDAAVARYRHVIEILRRDGYWAALMEDAEIDAQVDAARGGA